MSGTKMGSIKAKLGLRGPTKSGEMIRAMNLKLKEHSAEALSGLRKFVREESKEKLSSAKLPKEGLKHFKCKSCGMMHKTASALKAHMMKSHGKSYKTKGIKKTGKSFGKSNRLGGGGRFRQVEHAVAGKKGVSNPAGLAAYIGRRSLGKARFQHLAAAARK